MLPDYPVKNLDPKSLAAHPLNWGLHPEKQKAHLSRSLGEWGWLQTVLVNERTGRILDGHARVEEAVAKGWETIPCRVVDCDERTEDEILATFNRIDELRERDGAKLLALINRIKDAGGDTPIGYDAQDMARLQAAFAHVPAPPERAAGEASFLNQFLTPEALAQAAAAEGDSTDGSSGPDLEYPTVSGHSLDVENFSAGDGDGNYPPIAATGDLIKVMFLMRPSERDTLFARLNAVKAERHYETHSEALLYLLDVEEGA